MTTRERKVPDRFVPTMDDDDADIYCSSSDLEEWVSSSSSEEDEPDTDDVDFIDDDDDSDYVPPRCCKCDQEK